LAAEEHEAANEDESDSGMEELPARDQVGINFYKLELCPYNHIKFEIINVYVNFANRLQKYTVKPLYYVHARDPKISLYLITRSL
jgi:hypothetical protein